MISLFMSFSNIVMFSDKVEQIYSGSNSKDHPLFRLLSIFLIWKLIEIKINTWKCSDLIQNLSKYTDLLPDLHCLWPCNTRTK